jgi:hypothetical protein
VYTETPPPSGRVAEGGSDDLPVEHLQLPSHVNRSLRQRGVTTVGAARRFSRQAPAARFPYASDLDEAIATLERARTDAGVDWARYWGLRNWRIHHLAARLEPLQRLSPAAREISIDRTSFGNAGAMLRGSGITTLGMLCDGLVGGLGSVRGLGRGKMVELFRSLARLSEDISETGDIRRDECSVEPGPMLVWPQLPEAVRQLPLSILHIGQKSIWLNRAGYTTVGRILDAGPAQLGRLPSVGPRTVRTITKRLGQLSASSADGQLDLGRYCAVSGLVLIPDEIVPDGIALLAMLPRVVAGLSDQLPDQIYRTILTERLSRPPREQRTLEQIAQQSVPPITRERVRQKEKKLLTQLAASLIWSRDNELGIHFHPSFTALWKQAALEFAGTDEIGFDEFVTRLSRVWGVQPGELTEHLPIIIALVTGEPQMPMAFRAGLRLPPELLNELPQATLELPLRQLRIGRQAERLRAKGITRLGPAIALGRSGQLPDAVVGHLAVLAKALTPAGLIDWPAYADELGLERIPPRPPADARQFSAGFVAVVAQILHRTSTDRRVRIFELRSSRAAGERLTLDAVARILGAHGPSIKREETELLQHLHDVLVDGEFAALDIWVDDDWLRWVRHAAQVFHQSGGQYDHFEAALALRWGTGSHELQPAVPALWAIFNGYPQGGRRRRTAPEPPFDPGTPVEPARIRLAGFRRLH